ncbi:MAG TPA: porin family protein [Saprospiraceae bacterium]|nr:porin family protein [Saprospiraceae bacterium]
MKNTIIFLLGLLPVTAAHAQKTYFAAHGALQNTWIFCSDDSDAGGLLDYLPTYKPAFGLDFGYQFQPQLALQTGILYSLQGQRYETAGNVNARYRTNLEYLKFPLLLHFTASPERKLSFQAQAGFQLSWLTKAESSRLNVFGYYSPALVDVKSYYSTLPLDLVVGLGLQMKVRSYIVGLMLRMDYALTDIEKSDKKTGLRGPASNFTLSMPQLGVKYYF